MGFRNRKRGKSLDPYIHYSRTQGQKNITCRKKNKYVTNTPILQQRLVFPAYLLNRYLLESKILLFYNPYIQLRKKFIDHTLFLTTNLLGLHYNKDEKDWKNNPVTLASHIDSFLKKIFSGDFIYRLFLQATLL